VGLITGVLLLPLAPMRGVLWVAEQIRRFSGSLTAAMHGQRWRGRGAAAPPHPMHVPEAAGPRHAGDPRHRGSGEARSGRIRSS
jgi:hypothetical protein